MRTCNTTMFVTSNHIGISRQPTVQHSEKQSVRPCQQHQVDSVSHRLRTVLCPGGQTYGVLQKKSNHRLLLYTLVMTTM